MTRRYTLRRLARDSRPHWPGIALGVVLGTLAGLLSAVPPLAFGNLIAQVGNPGRAHVDVLYAMLLAIWLSLVLASAAQYGSQYLIAASGQSLINGFRIRLFSRILHLPLAEFDKWRPGDLFARFGADLNMMTDAVTTSVPQLISNSVTFAASFAAMVRIDWLLTLSILAVAPLVSIAVSRFQKLISGSTLNSQLRIADLSNSLAEMVSGHRVVKAFGRERYEIERFARSSDAYRGTFMKMTQFVATQPMVLQVLMASAVAVIIWLSMREVLVHRLDTPLLLTYYLFLVNLVNPINRFAAFMGDISKAIVGATRVYEILDLPVEAADKPGAVPLPKIAGHIAFEHVSFAYDQAEGPVLNGFNADIPAGQIVALVGPSGAGKTTIVNLVPRFYEPQGGRITIDGVDLANVKLADLRAQIGIVPQDPMLFRGTIAQNIRYGRLEAGEDEVRAAAREANAEEFVLGFPEGYQTHVGERGSRLSGGQRQRIAIARAILRDPRILILDEATSALDSHSEVLIEQALDRLLPGRTTLIIAHRLSTIRRANVILYIEGGRVLETGSHESLLARGGAYARLHATQFA
ncbi:MAG: ABC transporter ATP-binding protein [Candidatus Baltobacteraceae bacterium]